MLLTGTQKIEVSAPIRITVQADGEFVVYGFEGDERKAVLGPEGSNFRYVRCDVLPPLDAFQVVVKDAATVWSLHVEDRAMRMELPDPIPMEAPTGYRAPPTLQEELRRMVRAELHARAVAGEVETWEEANDLEVDSDEVLTPFEAAVLEDEYPVDTPPGASPPAEPLKEPQASQPPPAPEEPGATTKESV